MVAESSSIHDFFISYKHADTKDFAAKLKATLVAFEADVWLDSEMMHPGDSLLAGIEDGIRDSIDAIVIMSEHYFTGWAEAERSALFAKMVSKRLRIIPIWYCLQEERVQDLAPMFAGMKAIKVADDSENSALQAATEVMQGYKRSQRRARLFDLFFRAVSRHVQDRDLEVWIAVLADDVKALEKALQAGGDPNITDAALWNRYNKIITEHKDVFPAWRRLFLYLTEEGSIGGGSGG
ncbi:MAG: toll/interleukin-1 receptor domain-containing protein [Streptosporangiaceae bacterium]|jgi:hypothetical protein